MRDSRSPQAEAYRGWYKRKLWCHKPTGLRWQCLVKALFTCQDCGWQAKASETHLLVADHRPAHKGIWEQFKNPDILRCVCKPCHDSHVQAAEKGNVRVRIGLDGWPIETDVLSEKRPTKAL